MTKNINSTRYYSQRQEDIIAEIVGGHRQINSGAGHFNKGDVINPNASLLVECKCTTTNKDSFSIKKEWFDKNHKECFGMRMANQCIAFNFGPDSPNYFVIDEKLMKFLVEKIEEDA